MFVLLEGTLNLKSRVMKGHESQALNTIKQPNFLTVLKHPGLYFFLMFANLKCTNSLGNQGEICRDMH